MIDVRRIRESPDEVKAALARRGVESDRIDRLLELDLERRRGLKEVETLKAERNRSSKEIARLKKDGEDADRLIAELKSVSDRIKSLDDQLRSVEEEIEAALLQLPNLPLPEVPDGGPENNQEVREWGEAREFGFAVKPHWEIGEALGVLDLPGGAKVAGSGFPMFRGDGARLVRALVSFMVDLHTREHHYTELAPPYLVNADSARGTGQLPDHEDIMYVTEDGWYLIPTAEVPVTNVHRGEILAPDRLPLGYVAYSACFRREAGAHGKDTRGIIRVHQFDKVELVRFCEPERSGEELELLLAQAETVLQRLGLRYRVLLLAAGDMGIASAKTYDLEVWAPGCERWLEVSSASCFTDFQARRANIRYRSEAGGKPDFVHTLNASGVAIPRTLIALLENNQQKDGGVTIPEVLVPYFGSDRIEAGGE